MKSGIYLIKNTTNNKVYVGSAVNIDKRWKQHKKDLNEGKHHSCHLQSAWDKYGEQSFTFDILELVTNPVHLLAYEQVYLDYYKSYENDRGYNIYKVAGSPLGVKHTEEARRKISESNKGRKHSEETRQKLSEANKGRIVSEDTKNKISEANSGRKRTEEAKKNMSEAKKNISEETRKKMSEARKNISEETRKKLSEAAKRGRNVGRKHTEETKQKMSEAWIRRRKHNQQ